MPVFSAIAAMSQLGLAACSSALVSTFWGKWMAMGPMLAYFTGGDSCAPGNFIRKSSRYRHSRAGSIGTPAASDRKKQSACLQMKRRIQHRQHGFPVPVADQVQAAVVLQHEPRASQRQPQHVRQPDAIDDVVPNDSDRAAE